MSDRYPWEDGASEEYTPPKRENPYKKKKKETSPPSVDKWDSGGDFGDGQAELPSDEPVQRKKSLKDRWDDFIFAHVKLIVFIAGVTVVVMLLGPFSVFRIAEWVEEAQKQAEMQEKDALSMTYLRGLCDRGDPLLWRDMERFYYEDRSSDTYCTWIIPVDDDYQVWIGGASTARTPDYVTLYDTRTGRKVDLNKGLSTLDKFLAGKD